MLQNGGPAVLTDETPSAGLQAQKKEVLLGAGDFGAGSNYMLSARFDKRELDVAKGVVDQRAEELVAPGALALQLHEGIADDFPPIGQALLCS